MTGCIILANGRAPARRYFDHFYLHGYSYLICADGGANSAREMELVPDLIAGDLDSISEETVEFFSRFCDINRIEGQDDTDVEKCLKLAINIGFTHCILMGGTGDRLDHSFNNIGIALKYNDRIKISILSETSMMMVIEGNTLIKGVKGETVSLFGMDRETKFTTTGLKYPLNHETLKFGVRDGTSNTVTDGDFTVLVEGGAGILFREVEKVIESSALDSN